MSPLPTRQSRLACVLRMPIPSRASRLWKRRQLEWDFAEGLATFSSRRDDDCCYHSDGEVACTVAITSITCSSQVSLVVSMTPLLTAQCDSNLVLPRSAPTLKTRPDSTMGGEA